MKTNEIIKLANKRGHGKEPLCYGKHKSQEFIVYEKAALFMVKKGSLKQLRETATDKKRIKKISELSKSIVSLMETNLEGENIVIAEITNKKKTTKSGIEAVLIKAGEEKRWVDERFLSYFSPKRKAHFDISGWKNDIVFISETNELVGFICVVHIAEDSN